MSPPSHAPRFFLLSDVSLSIWIGGVVWDEDVDVAEED
jgi:hypothetical protein